MPRLAQAAERNVSTIDKLMAVLDESVRVMRDYPLAVAFDRAIRAESPRDLQLAENSDVRFMALHSLIREILEQGARENALAPGVDVDSAAGAIFLIFRGLNEYCGSALRPPRSTTPRWPPPSCSARSLFWSGLVGRSGRSNSPVSPVGRAICR